LGERDIFRLKGKDVRHRNLKKGLLFDDIRGILFICVHNSARSQIAEAWARALLPEAVKVWSAGSDPSDSVHPDAISVMRDAGINIGHQKPKKISSIPIDEVDVMIVMCGEELCPDLPDIKKRETWILPDPAKYSAGTPETIARMADIRDQIKNRILEFKKDLLKTPPQRDRAD
jgi:protein-tyrosine-phosphatase